MKGGHIARIGRYTFTTQLTNEQLKGWVKEYQTWTIQKSFKDSLEKAIYLMWLVNTITNVHRDGREITWELS